MGDAVIIDTEVGYLVGSTNVFGTKATYANDMGFIMSVSQERNCLDVTFTEVDETTIV